MANENEEIMRKAETAKAKKAYLINNGESARKL
jgi:hypothetical protein